MIAFVLIMILNVILAITTLLGFLLAYRFYKQTKQFLYADDLVLFNNTPNGLSTQINNVCAKRVIVYVRPNATDENVAELQKVVQASRGTNFDVFQQLPSAI